MNFAEAQTEFRIRLYRWAQRAQEKEIREGFPNFRLCKDGPINTVYFFNRLSPQERLDFAKGLLQERHQNAVKALGETMSDASQAMLRWFANLPPSEGPGFKNGLVAQGAGQAKPQLATRTQLKKAIKAHFLKAFSDRCLPPDPNDGRDMRFRMLCRGWTVKTSFEFGRWDPEIRCEHDVWTGKWITPEQPAVLFANSLGFRLNYGNEIGFGSGWEYLTCDDIEPACAVVVEHCRRMFAVFQELLKGLDLELLTP